MICRAYAAEGWSGLQAGGEIRNCRVESRIEGGRYGVGGMVGQLTSGTIANCGVTTEIRIGQWGSGGIGGLVGWIGRRRRSRTAGARGADPGVQQHQHGRIGRVGDGWQYDPELL